MKIKSIVIYDPFEARKAITDERISLLRYIKEKKPNSISDMAKNMGRDFRNVYRDVMILHKLGALKVKKTAKGTVPIIDYDKLVLEVRF